jgi:hypothetical protein
MNQQASQTERPSEHKPGYGVDRTQIRALLALTPEKRVEIFVASARNVAAIRDYVSKNR